MTAAKECEIHTIEDPEVAQAIQDSFSAGSIMNGDPIPDPFLLQGQWWTCVSANGVGITDTADSEFEAYRLVPEELFPGKSVSYSAKICDDCGDAAFYDPQGIYNGVQVQHAGKTFVLLGPPDTFIAMPDATPLH
jgi:hypothetical protein